MDNKPFDTITITFEYQGNDTYHANMSTTGGTIYGDYPSYVPVTAAFVEEQDLEEAARQVVRQLLNGQEKFTFDISEFDNKEEEEEKKA